MRSVTQLARELDMDERILYLNATNEVRILGDRYLQHRNQLAQASKQRLYKELREACNAVRSDGLGITVHEIKERIGPRKLNSVCNLYSVLSQIAQQPAANE